MPPLLRYWLLQLPGIALLGALLYGALQAGWIDWLTFGAILAAWVAKDALLYPFVRKAYAAGEAPHPRERLVGREGQTVQALDSENSGYVRIGGELWRARLDPAADADAALPGTRVRVQAADGFTLRVTPLSPDSD